MNVGILTQKWDSNYGGILQAAALQRSICQLGHRVTILDRRAADFKIGTKRFKTFLSRVGIHHLNARIRLAGYSLSMKQRAILKQRQAQNSFINRNINLSRLCHHPVNAKDAEATGADCWVVGSDQVWCYKYQYAIRDCFLAFCNKETRRKSITYAPSFGHDTWDAPNSDTEICRQLLADFKAVSVREESGCDLCKQVFGREAVFMPDPTLLQTPKDYCEMCNLPEKVEQENHIAYYVLDMTPEIQKYLRKASQETGLNIVDMMFDIPLEKRRPKDRKTPFRSVEQWIDILRKSKYVITDSFHGSVFSILFRKDFVCLGNANRGNARFDTLFGKLNLWDRVVSPKTEFTRDYITQERWDNIHATVQELRNRGIHYLKTNLNY